MFKIHTYPNTNVAGRFCIYMIKTYYLITLSSIHRICEPLKHFCKFIPFLVVILVESYNNLLVRSYTHVSQVMYIVIVTHRL